MLKLVILQTNSRNKMEIAMARGELLEVSEHNFCNKIKNLIGEILPTKGWLFKKKKWEIEEIRTAIDKAVAEVSGDLKRKTIKM